MTPKSAISWERPFFLFDALDCIFRRAECLLIFVFLRLFFESCKPLDLVSVAQETTSRELTLQFWLGFAPCAANVHGTICEHLDLRTCGMNWAPLHLILGCHLNSFSDQETRFLIWFETIS